MIGGKRVRVWEPAKTDEFPDRPDRPQSKVDRVDRGTHPVAHQVDRDLEVTELVTFIQMAIAQDDRELAKDVQGILKEVCSKGVNRQKVWDALTPDEKIWFVALLTYSEMP